MLGRLRRRDADATYAVTINPLVNWIWLGFARDGARHRPRAAAGDARSRSPAAKVPAGARRRRRCCCCCCCCRRRSAQRRHGRRMPRSALEQAARRARSCARAAAVRPMNNCRWMPTATGTEPDARSCDKYLDARDEPRPDLARVHRRIRRRRTCLRAPIDEGFNRLAWLFPYLVGATGAAIVGCVAFAGRARPTTPPRRASRRRRSGARERLDDELRDLD